MTEPAPRQVRSVGTNIGVAGGFTVNGAQKPAVSRSPEPPDHLRAKQLGL
jgi:hypothetical protein